MHGRPGDGIRLEIGGDPLPSGMARPNLMRWSGRSQDLLAKAVNDPAFVASIQAKGIPVAHLRLWVAQTDVPSTYRGRMRGWLEDWAHANAAS